eukprot:1548243-Pyramimonas_sp.AAC.1
MPRERALAAPVRIRAPRAPGGAPTNSELVMGGAPTNKKAWQEKTAELHGRPPPTPRDSPRSGALQE